MNFLKIIHSINLAPFIVLAQHYPDMPIARVILHILYIPLMAHILLRDIKYQRISRNILATMALIALIDATFFPTSQSSLPHAVAGGLFGYATFYLIYKAGFLYMRIRQKFQSAQTAELIAFGYGDVLLAGACGLILGLQLMIPATLLTIFLGAIGAIIHLLITAILRKKINTLIALPYTPYILAATLIMRLLGGQILESLNY